MNESIFLVSLGCDKNRIDLEVMANTLVCAGFELVSSPEEADCAVVNTCAFIESAKAEAIENIFDMLRYKQDPSERMRAVVVTGCLAQRYRDEIKKEIPELDAVTGLGFNADVAETVKRALDGEATERFGNAEELVICGSRVRLGPEHYAYIKIAEGCDNHCTYCAIPGIRGRFRSRRPDEIEEEARELVAGGAKELILVAQDTTAYGRDLKEKTMLAALLRTLCAIDGVWKVRTLYTYPEGITDELLYAISEDPKAAKYLDIPMQHANSEVLKRMGRGADARSLLALVGHIRDVVPGITLRSTFIAGFPGETPEQFQELLEFLDNAKLDRAGCFAYSQEEGTPAAKLGGLEDVGVRESRAESFMRRQAAVMAEKQQLAVGSTREVIVDGLDDETGLWSCRGENDIPEVDAVTLVKADYLCSGDIIEVKITETDGCDLYAELKV